MHYVYWICIICTIYVYYDKFKDISTNDLCNCINIYLFGPSH